MRNYAFDVVVFLLRGQPFHKAHLKIVLRALALGKHVIIVHGSHRKSPNSYNSWKTAERVQMIKACFDDEDLSRMHFTAVRDYPYRNGYWKAEVHTKVRDIIDSIDPDYDSETFKVGLIGYKKDDTSAYLAWFPQWEFIDTASFSKGVSATDIRNSFFLEMLDLSKEKESFLRSKTFIQAYVTAKDYKWRDHVPPPVAQLMEKFRDDDPERFQNIASEFLDNLRKKSLKEDYPFPIIENTVDSVAVKNAHVLLVKRGRNPGKGKWALPGGYLGEFEEKYDAAIRELLEETNFSFFRVRSQKNTEHTKKELAKCFLTDQEFGHPRRSTRGRVITRAFYFELPVDGEFPFVKGGDDADEAKWIPLGDLGRLEEEMFEDHLDIIHHFLWQPNLVRG